MYQVSSDMMRAYAEFAPDGRAKNKNRENLQELRRSQSDKRLHRQDRSVAIFVIATWASVIPWLRVSVKRA